MAPIYADDAAFNGPEERSARLLTLLLERGPVQGYFPEMAKLLFICDSPAQEEAENLLFAAYGL